jgi:hypothetical protein
MFDSMLYDLPLHDGTLNSRSTASAIILRISHGYEAKGNNDPFVDLADRAVDQFSRSTVPGAFMVDIVPLCKTIRFYSLPVIALIISISYFQWPTSQSCSLALASSA